MDMPVSPLKQEGRVGSRAIFIIWPKVMCTSLDSAGNMVGSKKNVVPNFMFVTMGGRGGAGLNSKPGRNTSLLAKDSQVCQSQRRHIFQEVLYL